MEKKNEIRNKKYEVRSYLSTVFLISSFVFLFPAISYASTAFGGDLTGFVCLLLSTIKIIVPILVGIAVLLFFWGVAKFILSAGNEKELENGRQFMIYGVIALFVLFSVWGIIQFLAVQFDFTAHTWQFLPTAGGSGSASCGSVESTSSQVTSYTPIQ
jgi:hypothetical protein